MIRYYIRIKENLVIFISYCNPPLRPLILRATPNLPHWVIMTDQLSRGKSFTPSLMSYKGPSDGINDSLRPVNMFLASGYIAQAYITQIAILVVDHLYQTMM